METIDTSHALEDQMVVMNGDRECKMGGRKSRKSSNHRCMQPIPTYIEYSEGDARLYDDDDDEASDMQHRSKVVCQQAVGTVEEEEPVSESTEDSSSQSASFRSFECDTNRVPIGSTRSNALEKAQQNSFSSTSLTASLLTYMEDSARSCSHIEEDSESMNMKEDEAAANLPCVDEEENDNNHVVLATFDAPKKDLSPVPETAVRLIEDVDDERLQVTTINDGDDSCSCEDDDNGIETSSIDSACTPDTHPHSIPRTTATRQFTMTDNNEATEVSSQRTQEDSDVPLSAHGECLIPLASDDDDLSEFVEEEDEMERLFSYEMFLVPLFTILEESFECGEEDGEVL